MIYKTMILAALAAILFDTFYVKHVITTHNNVNHKEGIIGIDISHHQGKIDWAKVGSKTNDTIAFIYIKATEGSTYQDAKYLEYFEGAKTTSIPVGSYHYFRTSSPIAEQFKNFISVVDSGTQDLIPMVDIEECTQWKGDKFTTNLTLFLKLIENHFGRKPVLYTVNSFYNAHLKFKYKDYMFCIGRYGPNEPVMFDGNSWTLWQYSDKGIVNGIEKPVDMDLLNINAKMLNLKFKTSKTSIL